MKRLLALLLFCPLLAFGQLFPPSGMFINSGSTGGGGSGTVTSFSAGNLSPIFTTSVATSTTTPALTFTLSTAGAYTVLGNNTGSTAAPAYVSAAFATSFTNGQILVSTGTYTFGSTAAIPSGTTATTQSTNDSSTKVATTAFVNPATDAIGTVTTSATFPWATSTSFSVTLTATDACVPTFTGATDGVTITIAVTTASTASINWSGGTGTAIKWTGGSAPNSSANGNVDFYTIKDVGGTLYGSAVLNLH